MKKSTLIAGIAVIGTFLTLTAANLKLKQEYTAGNIRKPLVEKKLAPFHFIKETLDRRHYYGSGFIVTNRKGLPESLSLNIDDQERLIFEVSNDTLFIKNNPLDKDFRVLSSTIYINANELKNVIATNGIFNIGQENTVSFSIIAGGISKVDIIVTKLDNLSIYGSEDAKIIVFASDTIRHASIQMKDNSIFEARDLVIKQKTLQLGNQASLQLTGRSLEDFGVKRN